MSVTARIAPLSGLAGIGCLVSGLALDRAPTSSWSDRQITDWYATHGVGQWMLSGIVVAAAAPFLLLFTAEVRERLAVAGASRRTQSVQLGAGIAFAVTALVGAALYVAVPAAMTFSSAPAPGADISRYTLGAAYGTLVMFSALAAALFTLTASVGSLRTRAIPRWLAITGLPFAALMLLNALLPLAAITLWFVTASITLAVRPPRTAVRPTAPDALPIPA